MLIDEVKVTIKAGKGGNGSASLRHDGQTFKGGPDGGDGGNGGSVYFIGVTDLTALAVFRYKKLITAEDGINGSKQKKDGRNANDLTIQVPVGTRITDLYNGKQYEIESTSIPVLLARGGKGGRGNVQFKSSTNQTPRYAEHGTEGQTKKLLLELRLIADIGLVGLPNAGKSSLLSQLTNAHPKIGNYPFTTLDPNLGMLNHIAIADIPGLIDGASTGKGLGIKFLKHIEKTKLLIHCISSTDTDPLNSYKTIRDEFGKFNHRLLEKNEIIALTKADEIDDKALSQVIKKLEKINRNIVPVSIYDDQSIEELKNIIHGLLLANQE